MTFGLEHGPRAAVVVIGLAMRLRLFHAWVGLNTRRSSESNNRLPALHRHMRAFASKLMRLIVGSTTVMDQVRPRFDGDAFETSGRLPQF